MRTSFLFGLGWVPALVALVVGGDREAASGLKPFGIEKRIPVITSTVVGAPEPPPPFRVKRVYPKFSPSCPILVKAIPGTDQLILITQPEPYSTTRISRIKDDPEITNDDAVTLLEQQAGSSAYDIAFHPNFAENGYFYVGWNGPKADVKGKFCRVTRYAIDRKAPFAFEPKSATTVIEWESDGHNGSAVCFGNDGMLYVTSGDGTSDSDKNVTGQKTDTLLAKVLRIDVDHPAEGKLYSVPKDNPFVADKRFVPETWAYGLRNPWRIACDEKSGRIWVGNNGQDIWETAHLVRKGENYGWSVTEGGHPFYPKRTPGPTPIVKPTIEHHHAEFRSLTGGLVYHGTQFPELQGAYLYGDYSTGRLWGMNHDGDKVLWHKELAQTRLQLTYFGLNTRGELLLCDHRRKAEGGLYTLEPTPKDTKPSTFPRKLSESGLFDSVKEHRMKPGVIPYSVNAPFWSDGLDKERFLMLPPGEQIGFTRKNGWNFPDKTVLVKSFALPGVGPKKWIETRFFTKQDNEWSGYSYLWNEAGTDAELVPASGLDREYVVDGKKQTWHYPSRAECMVCHSRAASFVLGLSEVQMNKTHDYNGTIDHQFRVFEHLDLFKPDYRGSVRTALNELAKAKGLEGKDAAEFLKNYSPKPEQKDSPAWPLLEEKPGLFRKLANPYDPKEDLTARARSWLHANCSSCHVDAGGGNAKMELEFQTAIEKMQVVGENPVHDTYGLPDAKLVAPGHPERSVLVHRVGLRGTGQMPPLATNRVDEAGLKMLKEWIASTK